VLFVFLHVVVIKILRTFRVYLLQTIMIINKGKWIRLLLPAIMVGIISICFNQDVSAQSGITEYEIKMTGNYMYGESFADSLETARNDAVKNLIQGIRVSVSTDTELNERETGSDYFSDYRSNIRMQSEMELEGLRYFEDPRGNGTWRVIAYISNEDFESMRQSISREMFLKLENAMYFENSGNYNRAIELYYEIFVETPNLPIRLFTNRVEHGRELELQQFARDKLIEWLNGVDLSVVSVSDGSSRDDIELYINLNVTHNGELAENLGIRLNRTDHGWNPVQHGRATVFYDLRPENLQESVSFSVGFAFPESNRNGGRSMIVDRSITPRNRTVDVDFSSIINLDFDFEKLSENRYQFTPKPGLLSVSNVEWKFGDGNQTTVTNPRHTFSPGSSTREVTLTFNRSPDLAVTKIIDPSGQVSESRIAEREAGTGEQASEHEYYMPVHHRHVIERIPRISDRNSLRRYLDYQRAYRDIAAWSNITPGVSQTELNQSYMIIINPETEQVQAIISPVTDGSRFNLISEPRERLSAADWEENFRGMEGKWFRFSR